MASLNSLNRQYWQGYKPGEIPVVPQAPDIKILEKVTGPILDVGTGDGLLAEELSKNGYDVYGIDIAENIIAENQLRNSKVKYSVQDIAARTNFSDNYFDLIVLRFTLTNIHKESWQQVGDELFRILKSGGKIWVLEPLVSESYSRRYELASHFVEDKNCVYVFHDKSLAEKIATVDEIRKAVSENKVSRIIKHYTIDELKTLFEKFEMQDHRIIKVTSPSGFEINTFEGVFKK